jgi:hypothetical protein
MYLRSYVVDYNKPERTARIRTRMEIDKLPRMELFNTYRLREIVSIETSHDIKTGIIGRFSRSILVQIFITANVTFRTSSDNIISLHTAI